MLSLLKMRVSVAWPGNREYAGVVVEFRRTDKRYRVGARRGNGAPGCARRRAYIY